MGCLLDNSKSFKIIPAINNQISSEIKKKEIQNNKNIITNVVSQAVSELISRLSRITSVDSLEIPGLLRAALCIGKYHSNYYDNNSSINNKNSSSRTNNKTNNRVDIDNDSKACKSNQIFVERNNDDIMAVTSLWKAILNFHDSLITGTKTLHSHLLLDSLRCLLWLTQSISLHADKGKTNNGSKGQSGRRNIINGSATYRNNCNYNSKSKSGRNFNSRKEEDDGDDDEDGYQWLAIGDRVRRAIPLLRLGLGTGTGFGLGPGHGSDETLVLASSLATAVLDRCTHPIAMTTQILDVRYSGLISKEISTRVSSKLPLNVSTDPQQEQNFRIEDRPTDKKSVCIYHYSRASLRLLLMTGQYMVECYPHISNINMMESIWDFVAQFTIPITTIGYADQNISAADKINHTNNNMNSNMNTIKDNIDETVFGDTVGKRTRTPFKVSESPLPSLLDFSSPSPTKSKSSSSSVFGTTFGDNLAFPSLKEVESNKSRVDAEIESEQAVHNILKFSLSWALDISLSDCHHHRIRTNNTKSNGGRPIFAAGGSLESAEALKVLKQHALWRLADNVCTKVTVHLSFLFIHCGASLLFLLFFHFLLIFSFSIISVTFSLVFFLFCFLYLSYLSFSFLFFSPPSSSLIFFLLLIGVTPPLCIS